MLRRATSVTILATALLASLLPPARVEAHKRSRTTLTIDGPASAIVGDHVVVDGRMMSGRSPVAGRTIEVRVDGRVAHRLTSSRDGRWWWTVRMSRIGEISVRSVAPRSCTTRNGARRCVSSVSSRTRHIVVHAGFPARDRAAPASGPAPAHDHGAHAGPGHGGASASPAPAPTATPPAGGPQGVRATASQDLIAAAHDDGTIDYPTSIKYRVWAMFLDERLPERYRGDGARFHDPGLVLASTIERGSLPADVVAELDRYLSRPTSERSALTVPAASSAGRAAPTTCGTACVHLQQQAPPAGYSACPKDRWLYEPPVGTLGSHVQVWVCRDRNGRDDTVAARADAQDVNKMLEDAWKDLSGYMRMPLGDRGGKQKPDGSGPFEEGSDSRVDVYVLDPAQARERNGAFQYLESDSDGAFVTERMIGPAANGFMLLQRNKLKTGVNDLRATVVHELFHGQQYAYNAQAIFGAKGRANWFADASAVWAEWRFLPWHGTAHKYFAEWFQTAPGTRLDLVDGRHEYGAYIWPFFVQQETGDDAFSRKVWSSLDGVTPAGWDDIFRAVDAQYGFERNYRSFALRNYNMPLNLDGTPYPGGKRYKDLPDPQKGHAPFRDGVAPKLEKSATLKVADKLQVDTSIPRLAAKYYEFTPADSKVRKMVFGFKPLQDTAGLHVDVFAELSDGSWRRIEDTDKPEFEHPLKLSLCRDIAGQDIRKVVLVLSNSSKDPSEIVKGKFVARARNFCADKLAGTITSHVRGTRTDSGRYVRGTITSDVTTEFDLRIKADDLDEWVDDGSTFTMNGHRDVDQRFHGDSGEFCYAKGRLTVTGNGVLDRRRTDGPTPPRSHGWVAFDPGQPSDSEATYSALAVGREHGTADTCGGPAPMDNDTAEPGYAPGAVTVSEDGKTVTVDLNHDGKPVEDTFVSEEAGIHTHWVTTSKTRGSLTGEASTGP